MAKVCQDTKPERGAPTLETLVMTLNSNLQFHYYIDHKLAQQKCWPPSPVKSVMDIEKGLTQRLRQLRTDRTACRLDERRMRVHFYACSATLQLALQRFERGACGQRAPQPRSDRVARGLRSRTPRQVGHVRPSTLARRASAPACFCHIAQVEIYELLAVEAARHGDSKAAYQALLADRLGPEAKNMQLVLADLIETNRRWLPRFFR